MRFLALCIVVRNISPLMGQLFYGAIPGSYSSMGTGGVPFYNSQPNFHSDPKYYASSQMQLPYYQNFQPNIKAYQPQASAKNFMQPPMQPQMQTPKATIESVKLPQPIQTPPNIANPSPVDQEGMSPPASKFRRRPSSQRQSSKAQREEMKPVAETEAPERAADESYEESPIPRESEDNPMQPQFPSDAGYGSNNFPQSSFAQPPLPQPTPSSAYGISNVRFGEVEHSCKEVKICVPIDPKNCWNGDHQAVRSFVFNQTDMMQELTQAEPFRKRRRVKKVVFSMPTTPSPDRKPMPPMTISKRKHTAPVVSENQPPFKVFELADPKKKVTFEPGSGGSTPSSVPVENGQI